MISFDPATSTGGFPWFSFIILYAVGLLGGLAVLPFTAELIRPKLDSTSLSLRKALSLQFLQTAVVIGITAFFGLQAALTVGLATSVTSQWHEGMQGLRDGWVPSLILGLLTSLLVCFLDYYLLLPRLPLLRAASRGILALRFRYRLLAILYGAFTEEIIMRLGVFSLLVWAMQALASIQGRTPWILWSINTLVSVLFAASHLPATAALVKLTPLLVLRTFLINGTVSLSIGYVYFTYGLEAAIICHLAVDIVLQLAGEVGKHGSELRTLL